MRTEIAKGPATEAADPLTLSGGTPGGTEERLAEAVKPLGLFMTTDHRYYWNSDGPYPSVTTILKVLDKPALTQWVARETAKAAVRHRQNTDWQSMLEEQAISFLLAQPKEVTDVAAKLGTSVHILADLAGRETAATGFEMPEGTIPYLEGFNAFLAFLRAQGGNIVSSEKAVVSRMGYAGTYDFLMQYRDVLWLVDVKTSKGYYPEYALQLAAYGMADFIALPNDPTEYPMPQVDRYAVLHLRPDQYPDTGWRLVEYPVTERDQRAFLATLDIWQWKKEGRFTKSILQKAMDKGELEGIRTDPLAKESED